MPRSLIDGRASTFILQHSKSARCFITGDSHLHLFRSVHYKQGVDKGRLDTAKP
jgi:hypothetical protein